MRAVLIDAGPPVALLDQSDNRHQEVVSGPGADPRPSGQRQAGARQGDIPPGVLLASAALWEILETGALQLLPLGADDIPTSRASWRIPRHLPMDMADAALVRVAEREGIRRVFTLDRRDFSVYQLARKGGLTLLP